ncbi:OmpA family protein [Flavobacterium johnsoniae]|uniref:OmpA/MotB domain protein n=1 Tax=Flavobacterium johnsoniae (strain ATCC 17061 / DSM 2064 / JCM 8514 / BCRC 14874 / CCUG 350202 / NBRC 14942 / NCIMB 11054 / UW101) TaxID=376686 RepID=A5FB74_FLAJ1|nr:OmpA family protein [Flavobacterium johnsoniae]ABQ07539.1 OmpA/MotB domain protein [Flavobacterium johnsoniae UW101]OXE99440.1 flagellar motor protein MotB [Flavobacterium johnsoniae UW101]WQG80623.1 OmpA family protein [Flavobacterium johnsoniae UW101]SHL09890.1 WD40-like Beta Propeller Repeat [Flavobacterium johnsoniae]
MKNYRLLCLIILNVFYGYSQQSKLNSADKKYDGYAYIDAIKTYERVADKGYKSEDLFKKLGNSYYFNSEFESAAKWYGELFAINTSPEAEYYYRYAQSLRSTGQTDKANKIMNEFNAKYKNDSRGKLYKEDVNYLDEIKANSGRYKIEDAGINSKYSDYGSFVYNNKIYFASARDTGNFSQRRHKWTGEYYTNIYSANIDPQNSTAVKPDKFKTALNTKFHESTPVFTKDGNTVYFTRNNYIDGKKGKDDNKITLIKLYKATLENGKWTKITALPFTSDNYSTAHPALSPDEKTLYFASDMPGSIGQSDIYKVSINSDGNFGTPQNLGKPINTEGKETFPYVTSENEIYFASDGHPGLGGLDVFVGQFDENGTVSDIQNLGNDINSPKDDFAYIIDPVSRQGYFSSNKDGGMGSDDIYKFLETKRLKCLQELYGVITDSENGVVLPGSKVTLYENQKIKNSTVSNTAGQYSFTVECGKTYSVRAEKPDYATKEVDITIAKTNGKTNLPIALDKSVCKVAVGDDLGKCFGIKMIYFDLDKSNIRTEAALDLEKILDVLNQNPTMKLDIRSHTDSRASHQYNEALSDRRAKSTISWLIQNGVAKNRLTGKGYGETQLVNQCSDGVNCTEEEHQMNRRSEFIITAL